VYPDRQYAGSAAMGHAAGLPRRARTRVAPGAQSTPCPGGRGRRGAGPPSCPSCALCPATARPGSKPGCLT